MCGLVCRGMFKFDNPTLGRLSLGLPSHPQGSLLNRWTNMNGASLRTRWGAVWPDSEKHVRLVYNLSFYEGTRYQGTAQSMLHRRWVL